MHSLLLLMCTKLGVVFAFYWKVSKLVNNSKIVCRVFKNYFKKSREPDYYCAESQQG